LRLEETVTPDEIAKAVTLAERVLQLRPDFNAYAPVLAEAVVRLAAEVERLQLEREMFDNDCRAEYQDKYDDAKASLVADRDEWRAQHENAVTCWRREVALLVEQRDEAREHFAKAADESVRLASALENCERQLKDGAFAVIDDANQAAAANLSLLFEKKIAEAERDAAIAERDRLIAEVRAEADRIARVEGTQRDPVPYEAARLRAIADRSKP